MNDVYVDFAEYQDNPIIKNKFCLYICTYVSLPRILDCIKTAKELKAGAVRYDVGWGFGNDDGINSPRELDAPQVSYKDNRPDIRCESINRVVDEIYDAGMEAMLVHAYTPKDLQEEGSIDNANPTLGMRSRWNTMPNSMTAWAEINKAWATHWRQYVHPVQQYEIWNEPDLQPVFFTGSKEDYCRIYRAAANSIKQANPLAQVGGPAISNDEAWMEALLKTVEKERLPLDYVSFHTYGEPENIVERIRALANNFPWLKTRSFQLTEYNPFIPATDSFTTNGGIEKMMCASLLLTSFLKFIEMPDVHRIYWAQLQDPEVYGIQVDRCGLLDLNNQPKPSYLAWKLFARLSCYRCAVRLSSDTFGVLASNNGKEASVLLWNKTASAQSYRVEAENMPFEPSICKCTVIEEDPAALSQRDCKWQGNALVGSLPPYGVCLYTFGSDSTKNELHVPSWSAMRYTQKLGGTMYAEWDAEEQAVLLGMGSNPNGPAWYGMIGHMPFKSAILDCSHSYGDGEGVTSLFVYDGANTKCYTNSPSNVFLPPWDKQWGQVHVCKLDKKIDIEDAKMLAFCLMTDKPGERMVWKLRS